ncbi:MAG: PEGA domain-containing protein [Myxococcota bacterium]
MRASGVMTGNTLFELKQIPAICGYALLVTVVASPLHAQQLDDRQAESRPEAQGSFAETTRVDRPDAALGTAAEPASISQGSAEFEPSSTVVPAGPHVEAARRHYAQGVELFRAERYEEAITELQAAWSLWENSTILYSLGQAHERLLRVPRAIHLYQRYVARADAELELQNDARERIRGLRMLLATLVVESNVPARLIVNGEPVGTAPGTFEVATGRHHIELQAPGYLAEETTLRIAAGTERHVALRLRPVPPAPQSRGASPVWFWLGAGCTAASSIAAVSLGALTLEAADRYDNDPTADLQQHGQRLALAADALTVTALVFAVGTLVLYLVTDWE